MTNGDKAAAKGWTVWASTQAHSAGYDDINYAMDRTADAIDAAATATALKLDASKIIISLTTPTEVDGAIWFKPVV